MQELTLHEVTGIELEPIKPGSGNANYCTRTIMISTTQGRFCISLFSARSTDDDPDVIKKNLEVVI